VLVTTQFRGRTRQTELSAIVRWIVDAMRKEAARGEVTRYIPHLAGVSLDYFGIAIAMAGGEVIYGGGCQTPFSIQSISKVFGLTLALGKAGSRLWERVGRAPSDMTFNSISQLETEDGIPRNPFLNSGALVVADINLSGRSADSAIAELIGMIRCLTDDDGIGVDRELASGEAATAYKNIVLLNYIRSFGNISGPLDAVIDLYHHQCAIRMDRLQLASTGRYLMTGGARLRHGRSIPEEVVRCITAAMFTCGLYNASGEFAFRVGIPTKSGVSGGILAIVPGIASIAVWSPGLGPDGNSVLGVRALEHLVHAAGWSLFAGGSRPMRL
jgi:glutaminase